jgi:hypothetical protein
VVAIFVIVGLVTIALSAGHPPRLSPAVRVVQPLPRGKGVVVYGTIRGSFGPFRRGFGQAIGRASLDLVAPDDRFLTLSGCIEEPRWQGILWPGNWFRTEIWFSEVLPELTGFESVRVRIRDRLGAERVSDSYPLSGGAGKPESIPDDVRWLALPGITMGAAGSPISADDSTLEVQRR